MLRINARKLCSLCVVGWGVRGGDCRCLKGLQLFWCPACCLTAGREGPVSRISLWAGFSHQDIFPIGGTFFLSVGHFSYRWDIFPIRGTFFLSVGHFSYPPAGHFSYRWDIFPDCGEDFRGGWVQNSTGQQEGRTTGCAPLEGYPRFAPGGGPKRRGTGFEQNTDINS